MFLSLVLPLRVIFDNDGLQLVKITKIGLKFES